MPTTRKTEDSAKYQAAAQYEDIIEMLAAVDCDYSRLEELKDELTEACEDESENLDFDQWVKDQSENENAVFNTAAIEYLELTASAGDCESEDDARERIQEDPLSTEVRSDWTAPGEQLTASEFMILLCTGGPAVRIVGELSEHGEPERAWLEYQDWGTPWTRYFKADSDTLTQYASNFFFWRMKCAS